MERQLYYYGFKRIRNSKEIEFQHAHIKDRQIGILKRKKTERGMDKEKSNEDMQKNIYLYQEKNQALLQKLNEKKAILEDMKQMEDKLRKEALRIEQERQFQKSEFEGDAHICISLLLNSFDKETIMKFLKHNKIFKQLDLNIENNNCNNFANVTKSIKSLIMTNELAKKEFLKVMRNISFEKSNSRCARRRDHFNGRNNQRQNNNEPEGQRIIEKLSNESKAKDNMFSISDDAVSLGSLLEDINPSQIEGSSFELSSHN